MAIESLDDPVSNGPGAVAFGRQGAEAELEPEDSHSGSAREVANGVQPVSAWPDLDPDAVFDRHDTPAARTGIGRARRAR